jgi:hypothetical protein
MMNVLMLISLTIGQCPPVECYAPIHEKIYYSSQIHSKQYVEAVLVSGRRIVVPVVNGYMPSVRVTEFDDGTSFREFHYDDQVPYDGGIVKYSKKPVPQKMPLPKTKTVEQKIPDAPKPEEVKTLQAVPVPKSQMRKPSEW